MSVVCGLNVFEMKRVFCCLLVVLRINAENVKMKDKK